MRGVFLFENFRQDSIHYPVGQTNRMSWLWDQAAYRGLTRDEVQYGLQELAEWVRATEMKAPTGRIWETV